jgi:hypothetical protein
MTRPTVENIYFGWVDDLSENEASPVTLTTA